MFLRAHSAFREPILVSGFRRCLFGPGTPGPAGAGHSGGDAHPGQNDPHQHEPAGQDGRGEKDGFPVHGVPFEGLPKCSDSRGRGARRSGWGSLILDSRFQIAEFRSPLSRCSI